MKPFAMARRGIALEEPTLGHDARGDERRKCQLVLANAESAERLARKAKPSLPEPVVDLHHVGPFVWIASSTPTTVASTQSRYPGSSVSSGLVYRTIWT